MTVPTIVFYDAASDKLCDTGKLGTTPLGSEGGAGSAGSDQGPWVSERSAYQKIFDRKPAVVKMSQTARCYFNKTTQMKTE